jgi:hypothetical protein
VFSRVLWVFSLCILPGALIALVASGKVFNIVIQNLLDAINSEGPGRTKRIGTAARWYLGLPQIMLRDPNRKGHRDTGVLDARLSQFLAGDYSGLLLEWERASIRARQKAKPLKQDSEPRRLSQCLDSFNKGLIGRGLCFLEGFGRAPADNPSVVAQMREKHPQRGESLGPLEPRPTESPPANLDGMKDVVMKTRALVGVGPRGLRPGHIKGLFKGCFSDSDARQARNSFEELGLLYLDGGMPRWLCRALTSGLLTPLVKKLPEHGEAPDARPTNAPDIDVSVWWKTLQRSVNPAVRKVLTPQQLGVAVANGTQIKVIGAALKIEQAHKEKSPYAHVALDLKNAHNEFSFAENARSRSTKRQRQTTYYFFMPVPATRLADSPVLSLYQHACAQHRPWPRSALQQNSRRAQRTRPHQRYVSIYHQRSAQSDRGQIPRS